MEKILLFFRRIHALTLLIVGIVLEVLSKFIEKYSANAAMFLQLLFFILFLTAIYKFLNRKK